MLSGINLGYNRELHVAFRDGGGEAEAAARNTWVRSTPTGGVNRFPRLDPFVTEVLSVIIPETSLQLVNVNFPPEPKGLCWARRAVSTMMAASCLTRTRVVASCTGSSIWDPTAEIVAGRSLPPALLKTSPS